MLTLKFSGTFQCRLSTDTDPPDEARGVSGYAQALAGEPSMDRIIRFQPPIVERAYCPSVGVSVRRVFVNGNADDTSTLLGARVDLLGDPKFEGRNGLIAEDGDEPIVPFKLEIMAPDGTRLARGHAESYEFWRPEDQHPFQALRASGVNLSPGEIAEETGVWDLSAVWADRARRLRVDLAVATDDDVRARIERRLRGLEQVGPLGPLRFYGARMLYFVELGGTPEWSGLDTAIRRSPVPERAWRVEMWLGGWDADAFQGFVKGYLHVPLVPDAEVVTGVSVASNATKLRPELANL